jgi:hypothetical protein
MRRVLPTLPLLCKAFQIQILATTHSLEVVDACIAVLPPEESSLVLYRLPDRTANDKTIRRFDGPDVKLMRSEYGMEVR